MPKLILIKHAAPQVDPSVPSDQWRLSDRGRESCTPLAEKVLEHQPKAIISSIEPKAVETAELVARHLNIPHSTAPDLHEHDRSNVPHLRSGEFISMVELFFRRPDELVLGRETAREAEGRFERAVKNVIQSHPNETIAIVSHGTVIALFLARRTGKVGFGLWRELGLPSMAVLDLPDFRSVQFIAKV